MTNPLFDFAPAWPEIFLVCAALVVLIADLFVAEDRRHVTLGMAIAAIVLTGVIVMTSAHDTARYAFGRMFVTDPMAVVLKSFACLTAVVTLVFARQYVTDRGMLRGEFIVLALFTLLGQMVMISAHNLLVVYLGLELMSLSLYALVAMRRDAPAATEASMKYFVLGALASGFLLYGMSMIYGATGTLDIAEIARSASTNANRQLLLLGTVFIVGGIAFKLSAAPFHMWAPDVYDGAPTAVTLLIAAAPKLAAFAIAIRVLAQALPSAGADWHQMFAVLAVLSLAIGNLTAIAQTNLKRLLAYSTIAQIGFVLLGFMAARTPEAAPAAYGAAMYYTVVYVLTTLGTFGVMLLLARKGFECDRIDDLAGLNQRAPWLAFVMLLMMFSLAGIPPAVGFYAKLVVLQATVDAGYLGIAIFAVLASLVGAFYYLRVVKVMYFDGPTHAESITGSASARFLLALTGAFVIVFGIVGEPLLRLCLDSIQATLAL
ncbi:MAG TPA: NADH-quinone oxidoreductase subunit NuoN [Burkholderiaceae bacterium]|nr:NADH-quinone oxidoreductase subunit NuoN [Burkholderiaceae bacterium]